MGLILEQQSVHGPELPLRTGALGSLGRLKRMRMRCLLGEMPVHEADSVLEALQEQGHSRSCLLASGAFEVAVLHHSDRRVRISHEVVSGSHWLSQIAVRWIVHRASPGVRRGGIVVPCTATELAVAPRSLIQPPKPLSDL
jgi:hypothetical protein